MLGPNNMRPWYLIFNLGQFWCLPLNNMFYTVIIKIAKYIQKSDLQLTLNLNTGQEVPALLEQTLSAYYRCCILIWKPVLQFWF